MGIRFKEKSCGAVFKGNDILEIFTVRTMNFVFKKVTMMKQQQILLFLTWIF